MKHKFSPWRIACFLRNLQNDKNYALKGGVPAPGLWSETNENMKMYQRLQKGLIKVRSRLERGGHVVSVVTDTDAQGGDGETARMGVAHN